MAMRDWNKNGKDDAFDMLTDYYLYKQTFGKDENDEKRRIVHQSHAVEVPVLRAIQNRKIFLVCQKLERKIRKIFSDC